MNNEGSFSVMLIKCFLKKEIILHRSVLKHGQGKIPALKFPYLYVLQLKEKSYYFCGERINDISSYLSSIYLMVGLCFWIVF